MLYLLCHLYDTSIQYDIVNAANIHTAHLTKYTKSLLLTHLLTWCLHQLSKFRLLRATQQNCAVWFTTTSTTPPDFKGFKCLHKHNFSVYIFFTTRNVCCIVHNIHLGYQFVCRLLYACCLELWHLNCHGYRSYFNYIKSALVLWKKLSIITVCLSQ